MSFSMETAEVEYIKRPGAYRHFRHDHCAEDIQAFKQKPDFLMNLSLVPSDFHCFHWFPGDYLSIRHDFKVPMEKRAVLHTNRSTGRWLKHTVTI